MREAVAEQVKSVGANFISVQSKETRQAETKSGYARELSKAYQKKQEELLTQTIPQQDIIITTALIPEKPAPQLISAAMVKSMKSGSVIVDLAAVGGGNCALTEIGTISYHHGVTIIGDTNLTAKLAHDASHLYARNIAQFVTTLFTIEQEQVKLDEDDDLLKATQLTHST